MILLNDSHFIGKGMMRSCYHHPDDSLKCIKIYHSSFKKNLHEKEIKEISRLTHRKHTLIIPKYHGITETNRGKGFVFDLVKDEDEKQITLKHFLKENDYLANDIKSSLYSDLLKSAAVFAELNIGNIMVVQKGESIKFAIVDGLGEGTAIKICSLFPYFARKKFKRKWRRLSNEIDMVLQKP